MSSSSTATTFMRAREATPPWFPRPRPYFFLIPPPRSLEKETCFESFRQTRLCETISGLMRWLAGGCSRCW